MMAGNPNWWSINSMHPQFSSDQFVFGSNPSLSPNPSESDIQHDHQDFPARGSSWSQLLLGGLAVNEEENRFGGGLFQQQRKLQENLYQDLQVLNLNPSFTRDSVVDIKQDYDLDYDHHHQYFQANRSSQPSNNINSSWPHQLMPVSSPTSCTTNLSHSLLNFSVEKATVTGVERKNHLHNQEHSFECNSIGNGGVPKKARVQHSSPQPALKIRKEKLGDRITALHQIVSPFGKTDTASVLTEAIRHIRFLEAQIEALSGPYMRYSSADTTAQHSVQERNSFFHEEHGKDSNGAWRVDKDLRSRGLCLVPISYTQHLGNDVNGVDYWAPPPDLGGAF